MKLGKPSRLGGRLHWGPAQRSSPDDAGRLSGAAGCFAAAQPDLLRLRSRRGLRGRAGTRFTATTDTGERVSLSDFRGKPVVLYFYPKDDTPGCTAQACGIRDAYAEFERAGAVVLGVSPDAPRSM